MGKRLVKAFDIAKTAGGLQAEMRLAMKSGMSRQKAETEQDTPDRIEKMEQAVAGIVGKSVSL